MSLTLQLLVARGTARGLINGIASPDYGEVITLRKYLLQEGEHGLAFGLLTLAKTMQPT
ncbi:hypothetical protein [Synechococcus sp. HK01-R]|uniref:hypothetical protein n=1 Tax=Synechococcus sp. HK01-R TaxID=2751171 RepID=UPI00162A7401|nr:hypothetical protein [Synechococcus sp. HK01-R]QNG26180.1 hypothetical protein H0O21_07720 [Synechococcus sp. HK01-R]